MPARACPLDTTLARGPHAARAWRQGPQSLRRAELDIDRCRTCSSCEVAREVARDDPETTLWTPLFLRRELRATIALAFSCCWGAELGLSDCVRVDCEEFLFAIEWTARQDQTLSVCFFVVLTEEQ